MRLVDTTQEQADAILAAMAAVASGGGAHEPSPADRAVLAAAAKHVLDGAAVPTNLDRGIPEHIADVLPDPQIRELALTLASVVTFADPDERDEQHAATLDPARVAVVRDLAERLGTSTRDVHDLEALTKGHHELVEYCAFRRFVGSAFGIGMGRATAQATGAMVGTGNREHHEMWARIEKLPDDTLGAQLVRYYHENGWPYPGTAHRQPLSFAIHDFHHVLGGYPTTPHGELQVGAFTGGAAERPLDVVMFFLMWEQLGVRDSFDAVAGAHDKLELEPFFAALERGARTNGGFIGAGWEPWSLVEHDLDDVRAQFDIRPGGVIRGDDAWNRDPVHE